jgi:glutamate-1-semialdehyde 2,1-aminomutase
MSRSKILFQQAQQFIPGGVNSPVRAFQSVGGDPVFMEKAEGAYLFDVDGKRYIDYVLSWGPMIHGHAHPDILDTVSNTLKNGLSFGTPTELETALAEKICGMMPNMDLVRMTNSGTEATMSAIRLARAYTKRDKIIKFEGCYHGHADSLLIKAGSGALTLGEPSSPGVPVSTAEHTITLPYNDSKTLEQTFSEIGEQVAAIIVEPVAGNMNCIPPLPGFLEACREQCTQHQSLLILDEVMTGFRLGLSGAQGYYNIEADLTTLGKVIGGGMPVGAFGGKQKIMEQIAPLGPVYQAGTLSGNPVAMSAGLASLELLETDNFYPSLFDKTSSLVNGLQKIADDCGVPFSTHHIGSMFGLFFSAEKNISSFQQATACNTDHFKQFFHGMLDAGIYLAPSAFESGFLSAAHSENDIRFTLEAAKHTLAKL